LNGLIAATRRKVTAASAALTSALMLLISLVL
jgi:hypothetical protein